MYLNRLLLIYMLIFIQCWEEKKINTLCHLFCSIATLRQLFCCIDDSCWSFCCIAALSSLLVCIPSCSIINFFFIQVWWNSVNLLLSVFDRIDIVFHLFLHSIIFVWIVVSSICELLMFAMILMEFDDVLITVMWVVLYMNTLQFGRFAIVCIRLNRYRFPRFFALDCYRMNLSVVDVWIVVVCDDIDRVWRRWIQWCDEYCILTCILHWAKFEKKLFFLAQVFVALELGGSREVTFGSIYIFSMNILYTNKGKVA